MTAGIIDLLTVLQFSDSSFPSGAFTFSWGIEQLIADGLLDSKQDLVEIVEEFLLLRWRCMDRILLRRAHGELDQEWIVELDQLADASTPLAVMREGSRRAGRQLLKACAQIGIERADKYHRRIRGSTILGHLPVVQGLVLGGAGLDVRSAELVSAWTGMNGLVNAAVRLGVIGHVDAQDILTGRRLLLGRILECAVDPGIAPSSFTPLIDIAISKSVMREYRIFVN